MGDEFIKAGLQGRERKELGSNVTFALKIGWGELGATVQAERSWLWPAGRLRGMSQELRWAALGAAVRARTGWHSS